MSRFDERHWYQFEFIIKDKDGKEQTPLVDKRGHNEQEAQEGAWNFVLDLYPEAVLVSVKAILPIPPY